MSGDFPYGPLQEGPAEAVRAAIRLVKEAGVDMVKLDGAADYLEAVRARRPGRHPGVRPVRHHPADGAPARARLRGDGPARRAGAGRDGRRLVAEAKALEDAGAALLDFTNSGPVVGAEVARPVSIPVLGGFGGGPWLDGRVRMAHAAIGYAAAGLDDPPDTYANVARITLRRARGVRRRRPGRATRSAAASRCRAGEPDRANRRPIDGIRHPVRGGRGRAAAADVLARRVRLDAGELDPARHLPADRADGPAARAVTPASRSTGASRGGPAAGWSGSAGTTGSPRASGCSTTSASSGRT